MFPFSHLPERGEYIAVSPNIVVVKEFRNLKVASSRPVEVRSLNKSGLYGIGWNYRPYHVTMSVVPCMHQFSLTRHGNGSGSVIKVRVTVPGSADSISSNCH